MADSPGRERDIIEHEQEKQRKAEQEAEEELIREAIEYCSKALTRNQLEHYLFLAEAEA